MGVIRDAEFEYLSKDRAVVVSSSADPCRDWILVGIVYVMKLAAYIIDGGRSFARIGL
jgi:hypothetical protein